MVMAIRKVQFATGEYYHIFNRGVDKRDVFLDEENFGRFFESMRDFNALEPIGSLHEHRFRKAGLEKEFGPPEPLVHIICYCLNPNHYHFLLEQVADRGVERFMQRIGTGYTKYFNAKYQRSGSLFQGKFKAAHIDSNEYLLHVSAYINLNDKVHKLGSKASKSSWGEYLGQISGHDSLCKKDIILRQFKDRAAYKLFALRALPRIQERKDLQRVLF